MYLNKIEGKINIRKIVIGIKNICKYNFFLYKKYDEQKKRIAELKINENFVIKLRVKINDNSVNDIPLQEINTSNNSRFWIGSVNLNEKNRLLVVLQDLTGKYLIYDFD